MRRRESGQGNKGGSLALAAPGLIRMLICVAGFCVLTQLFGYYSKDLTARFLTSSVQSRSKNSTFQGLNWVSGMSGNGCIVEADYKVRYSVVLDLQGYSHASSALVK